MRHKCRLNLSSNCLGYTGFFIWSTSRNFPRDKLIKIMGLKHKDDLNKLNNDGYPICFACFNELKRK